MSHDFEYIKMDYLVWERRSARRNFRQEDRHSESETSPSIHKCHIGVSRRSPPLLHGILPKQRSSPDEPIPMLQRGDRMGERLCPQAWSSTYGVDKRLYEMGGGVPFVVEWENTGGTLTTISQRARGSSQATKYATEQYCYHLREFGYVRGP